MIKQIKADIVTNKNNTVTNVYANATTINQTKGNGTTNIVLNIDTATCKLCKYFYGPIIQFFEK
jgi:hypothetical protein